MRAHLMSIGLLTAALSLAEPASATVLIRDDNGGLMEDYTKRFAEVGRSGERVVIDGTCVSACTMVLGLVPRHRICATERAVFGFHAAWQYTTAGARVASAAGTRDLMRIYPASVRAWIARQGGLKPGVMFLRGPKLAAIVPICGEGSTFAAARVPRLRNAGRASIHQGRQASADPR